MRDQPCGVLYPICTCTERWDVCAYGTGSGRLYPDHVHGVIVLARPRPGSNGPSKDNDVGIFWTWSLHAHGCNPPFPSRDIEKVRICRGRLLLLVSARLRLLPQLRSLGLRPRNPTPESSGARHCDLNILELDVELHNRDADPNYHFKTCLERLLHLRGY